MHILIVAVGSAGDVYPFISIGGELRRRGHTVHVFASAAHQSRIENAGLAFSSAVSQTDLDAAIADADVWNARKGFAAIWKRMGRQLPAAYAKQLAAIHPGETILVASSLAVSARLLQETQGLNMATVHLAPSCIFSADESAMRGGLPGLSALPSWAVRAIMKLIEKHILDPLLRADLDPLRASLGLAPVRRVMGQWLHSPQRVICAFPDWFAAPQADWPPNTLCATFPRLPAAPDESLGAALQAFLAGGPAPIAFTPGSAMAHGRLFFQRAIAASAALGRRAVLVTPYREQLPDILPPFVHHEAYVPFDLLAPRVAAFVHHGGIGTCAQALAAGKPQLITPFAFDQPDNAARLKKLGVAASVAPNASVGKWVRALSQLLNSPATLAACQAMAARMAQETPASEQIAGMIEALAVPSLTSQPKQPLSHAN
ncbi:glycosyltransferase [Janthinobacterium fluminis]|uniref:Glycosyltransferase n=1 Tax=Janthinobacterium fluminis TaxID=2987524 RepID=A0ABT5JWH6_9BURK|nr:nucleotide disphospho-sugar-binding domain-containing protein [Janthinobacterium fluminis]MDC8757087.1 glycosyltransferase [Janthinobacterium fluminis]